MIRFILNPLSRGALEPLASNGLSVIPTTSEPNLRSSANEAKSYDFGLLSRLVVVARGVVISLLLCMGFDTPVI